MHWQTGNLSPIWQLPPPLPFLSLSLISYWLSHHLALQLFPISFFSSLVRASLLQFSSFSSTFLAALISVSAHWNIRLHLGATEACTGACVPQECWEETPRLMPCQWATLTATIITGQKGLQAAIRYFRWACRLQLVCLGEWQTHNPVPVSHQPSALLHRWVFSSRQGNVCSGQFGSHLSLTIPFQH